jgi:hypothetical protein
MRMNLLERACSSADSSEQYHRLNTGLLSKRDAVCEQPNLADADNASQAPVPGTA